jgi:hypothetical protein
VSMLSTTWTEDIGKHNVSIISINIHNSQLICKSLIYMATSYDPRYCISYTKGAVSYTKLIFCT